MFPFEESKLEKGDVLLFPGTMLFNSRFFQLTYTYKDGNRVRRLTEQEQYVINQLAPKSNSELMTEQTNNWVRVKIREIDNNQTAKIKILLSLKGPCFIYATVTMGENISLSGIIAYRKVEDNNHYKPRRLTFYDPNSPSQKELHTPRSTFELLSRAVRSQIKVWAKEKSYWYYWDLSSTSTDVIETVRAQDLFNGFIDTALPSIVATKQLEREIIRRQRLAKYIKKYSPPLLMGFKEDSQMTGLLSREIESILNRFDTLPNIFHLEMDLSKPMYSRLSDALQLYDMYLSTDEQLVEWMLSKYELLLNQLLPGDTPLGVVVVDWCNERDQLHNRNKLRTLKQTLLDLLELLFAACLGKDEVLKLAEEPANLKDLYPNAYNSAQKIDTTMCSEQIEKFRKKFAEFDIPRIRSQETSSEHSKNPLFKARSLKVNTSQ